MRIFYNISEEDIRALNISYLEQSPDMKRILKRSSFVTPIILLFLSYPLAQLAKMSLYETVPLMAVFGVAYYFLYPRWMKSRIIKAAIKSSQHIIGQNSLEMREDHIVAFQPNMESKIDWNSLLKVDESLEHLFIYITSGNVLIVPLQQISAFEKSELINFLAVKKDIPLHIVHEN